MNHACKATSLTEPSSGGGLLLLRRKAPLKRRSVAYFCSGAHKCASGEGTHVPRPQKQLAKGSFFRLKPFYDFWHCHLTEKIKAVPIALTLATGLSNEALSYNF
jgi:hypothetical protein